ncbi:tetratricopeptide repeat protein [Caldimonas tepidiphila]|uniref:tetratricopeptide repeat protein n=1 Tax=Caldimonas tepidiphila TaxID=2315841 RepID=UPI001F0BF2A4|nr:tetratricopeptide repeat protein [Caldimonas tepidiphila]
MSRSRPAWRLRRASLRAACTVLLLLGRTEAARGGFERLLALDPDDADALASCAHLRAQAGDDAGAIADYRRLLARYPAQGAAPWFNLGYLLERSGRLGEAEAAFRAALALDERLDRAWYGLGLVLAGLGRDEEAIAALRRNVELQPLSPHGHERLVHLHLRRQELDEARRLLRQLRGFEPVVAARLERQTGLAA